LCQTPFFERSGTCHGERLYNGSSSERTLNLWQQ
jgi:hypothetical protein